MKILHILTDGGDNLELAIIRAQQAEHEIMIADLTKRPVSYDDLVNDIFSCDRVISWNAPAVPDKPD